MPIDRETALRQAEKLNREGKIDLAIAEYVRLVDEQPRDWNSINALGDLYLRAGNVERAVAQFVQIADHLFGEGFLPKAAAVYKKALKAKSDHEHALLRLADIAATQELLADARACLRRLWELRSGRGDEDGAADCLVRLASLPEADIETRLTGARAARLIGETQRAADLFRSAAVDLEATGRSPAAAEALAQALALDPSDAELRRRLANQHVAAGELDAAARLLDDEAAGSDPELVLSLASLELTRGNDEAARAALLRFLGLAPDRGEEILRLAGELGRAGEPDRAFGCTAIVVDDAVVKAEWDRAIDVLQSFLVHGAHIPALVRLAGVAEEAGAAEVLQEARERLVDAHLSNGEGEQAQALAEALLTSTPESAAHARRLRRAVELTGTGDPDEAVRRVLERCAPPTVAEQPAAPTALAVLDEEPQAVADDVTLISTEDDDVTVISMDDVAVMSTDDSFVDDVSEPPERTAAAEDDRQPEPIEIDLSDIVALLGTSRAPAGLVAQAAPDEVADLSDLDAVLNAMRPRGGGDQQAAEAASVYERGVHRLERGQVREGLEDLEEAARMPAFRFPAAARLGREYIKRGQANAGIEWLGRAADAPAPSRDALLDVLYDLGVALEHVGEGARALAVLMELAADAENYRDVPQRIEVLTRQEDERRG